MFIGGILIVIALLYYFTNVSRVLLFWAAFILTRPLGATLANSLDKPLEQGGLNLNDITITAVLAVVMLFLLVIIPQRA
ncbi:hypothetical protein OFC63_32005, partial [Escherichia coli]|nr:hypothetical protein [Escherichia coli]